jgi:predicted transcriptional regulator
MKTYPDLPSLRAALAAKIAASGLTQQDVSRATGVTQSAISMFLGEKRGLNADSVLRIIGFVSECPLPPRTYRRNPVKM